MKEENRKEFLTKNIVAKELTSVYGKNLLIRLALSIPLVFFTMIYSWVFSEEGSRTDEFAEVGVSLFNIAGFIFALVVFACFVYWLYSVYKFVLYLFLVKNSKFDIVVDKLVYSERDGGHKFNVTEYELEYQPDYRIPYIFLHPKFAMFINKKAHYLFRLQFAKHKNFYIPEGKLYRWSDKYRMEHWAVYRWAEIGDEFYLITLKDKVLYAYNTKHFELHQ